jgi:cytochrome c oxidase subunit 2
MLLVGCLGALLYASTALGVHLPGHVASIDPAKVSQTAPFDHPGVRETAPGKYEVVIVAQAWSFTPAEIRVPVNAEIRFTATTTDVIHGFDIAGTRMNMMLIPGQVSSNTYSFRKRGEYLLVCHEYCGIGHHTMAGKVIVE